ncbi:MAG: 3-isopropylmalate dehydrogenase [Planctomycetes bacterium]|nr:3-isopropylmalate dehydrogenase [Planctomycetota bacterium]
MIARIAVLPGDGIGPEVTASAVQVLRAVAARFGHEFTFLHGRIGGDALDHCGSPLPADTMMLCKSSHAVLLGAVGGPKWSGHATGPEAGLLALRQQLGGFANLRPVRLMPELEDATPFRPEHVRGVDMLIVRELTGGAYFGCPRGRDGDRAFDTMAYTVDEVARVARVAFGLARARRRLVTSVDKANVLESSRLWREVVTRMAADFPDVRLRHMLVDAAALALMQQPRDFDVLLTENLFGDILSDQAAVLAGGIGVLPSAAIGGPGPGLFEPVHGSAPDIAGRNIANPVGALLSAALLCEHGLGLHTEAESIRAAVGQVLGAGCLTADLGGTLSSTEFTWQVTRALTSEGVNITWRL